MNSQDKFVRLFSTWFFKGLNSAKFVQLVTATVFFFISRWKLVLSDRRKNIDIKRKPHLIIKHTTLSSSDCLLRYSFSWNLSFRLRGSLFLFQLSKKCRIFMRGAVHLFSQFSTFNLEFLTNFLLCVLSKIDNLASLE